MAAKKATNAPPPAWFAAALGAQWLISRHRTAAVMSRTVSIVLAAGSGMLALSAVATLARADTQIGPEHPEDSTTLVTGGPYRLTRNPIYLALAGILVAHATLRRSVAALAPVAGFVGVLDRTQIPAEERALSSRFKRAYGSYRHATPRWIRRGKR